MASEETFLDMEQDWDRMDDDEYSHWTMGNGEKIAVEDMDDNHLRNTIAFLKRLNIPFPTMLTDWAQDVAEDEYEDACERRDMWITVLQTELGYRNKS